MRYLNKEKHIRSASSLPPEWAIAGRHLLEVHFHAGGLGGAISAGVESLVASIPGVPPDDLGGGSSCLGIDEVQFLIFDTGSFIIVNLAVTLEFIVSTKVVRVY